MTRSEPALICGFFGLNAVRRFSYTASKISSVIKKSMSYVKKRIILWAQGNVRPDWICIRVVPLDRS